MFARPLASFRQNGKSGKSARRARRLRRSSFQPRLERLEDRALLAADLQITKTDNLTSAAPGTSATYTITVTNAGPDPVTGATVTDNFNAALFTGVSYTATATGGATGFSAAGTGNISNTVTLPSGSTITYTATAAINPAATGSLSNTATVTAPAGVTDSNPGNNSAIDSDTQLAPAADLKITKTDNRSFALPGSTGSYAVVVTNIGPSNVVGATVNDTLPAGFTAATFTATSTGGASGFTASGSGNISDIVNLPSGSTITYLVTGNIAANASGTMTNSATVTTPAGVVELDSTNNTSVDANVVASVIDLQVTKTDGAAIAVAGSPITYTVVVNNNGSVAVNSAAVSDAVPASLTGVTYTATAAGGATGFTASGSGAINDTVNLPSGSVITYVVSGTVSASATGSLSNTATVATPVGVTDANTANNSSTDTDMILSVADLQITKTDNRAFVQAGATDTYTIVVTNAGPSAVAGATVTDTFPAALTGVSFTATATGGATGFTASGTTSINDTVTLPAGSTITYVVNGTAGTTGTMSNTATVTAPAGTVDVNLANNTGIDVSVVGDAPVVDAQITKTDGKPAAVPGVANSYIIVVSNNGSAAITGATVADAFPATFTGVTFTATATGGATGFTASGSGNISDTVNLPIGSTITYVANGIISAAATGTLSNTATVTAAGDVDTANNTSIDTDLLTTTPVDVAVTKSDLLATAVPGQTTTYTVVVTNSGPNTATNVTVADSLPAGVMAFSWSGNGHSNQSGAINDVIASLASGASVTYTVVASIDPAATGTLANTVTITAANDINAANDTATDSDVLTALLDVSVTKTDNAAAAIPGQTTTYTIVVSNSGPSTATNVLVSDPLPVGVTSFSWSGNGLINQSGAINDTIASLAPGASVTYTVVATIGASATGTLTNAVTVTAAGDTSAANDVATDVDTLTATTTDVSVTKTDGVSSAVAGQTTTYTIVVANTGASAATNVVVSDPLPIGVTSFTWSGNGLTNQTGAINDTIASLAAGDSVTYTVAASISPSATGSVSNVVTISAVNDINTTNNVATDTDALTSQVDVQVTKTDSVTTVVAGQTTTYTVVVTNNGPSTATNVSVSDPLPTGVTSFSWSGNGLANQTGAINDTIFTLDPGASVTYTVVATVSPSATGSLTNTVTISAAGDTNSANNVVSDIDTLTTQVDVGVTKTDNVATVVAGLATTYTVVVTNSGPSTATNVLVSDPLPSGVTSFSWSGNGLTSQTGSISNTIASLAPGASVTYTVVATVSPSATGSVINTATVTAAGDTNTGNNSATDTDTVTSQVDVGVTKTDGSTSVSAGDTTTYTVVVTNSGPSTATSVLVSDPLPSGVTSFSWSGNGLTNQTGAINNTIATLAPGASVTYTVVASVDASATGSLANTVTVTAAGDTNAANNSAIDTDSVLVQTDLSLTKSGTPVTVAPGQNLTYTIVVTNTGVSAAENVSLIDVLPADTTFVSFVAPAGWTSVTPAVGGTGIVTSDIASLAAGASATFTLVVHVDAAAVDGTVISNSADVTTTTAEIDVSNNTALADVTVSLSILQPCEITTLNVGGVPGTATLEDDADSPGAGVIIVTGTSGDDVILIERRPVDPSHQIRVMINGRNAGIFNNSDFDRFVVFALAGNDVVNVFVNLPQDAIIFGGVGNDVLIGGAGQDGIDGGAGIDVLYGGWNNDTICGGAGNDFIYGNQNNDILGGDDGNDSLFGAVGDDQLQGGNGNDRLFGGNDQDRLYGQAGNDSLYGELGADILVGGVGNDLLFGNLGRDLLIGGTGVDTLFGEGDDDILVGDSTIHDKNETALMAILAEWRAAKSYPQRVFNIRNGGGENGAFVLHDTTIDDDGSSDTLWGDGGLDWFLLGVGDRARDKASREFTSIN